MIAHNGLCLVHRAEILMFLCGEWENALAEARRAVERFTRGALNQLACGSAFYCQGEVHRLRGAFDAAEDAYRQASAWPRAATWTRVDAAGPGKAGVRGCRRSTILRRDDGPYAKGGVVVNVQIMLAAGVST